MRTILASRAAVGAALALSAFAAPVRADPCLTNPADVVGNPTFGATVATFIARGIDPNVTCIENGLWTDPANFTLGDYVKGADGQGHGTNNAILGQYVLDGPASAAADANARDHAWVQDIGNQTSFGSDIGGRPSQGIVWDLHGAANQVAIFVFVDHGPVPQEVLENSAWLSNDPNAADGGWTQASLVHVYGAGWDPDPTISDGFVAVYQLPGGGTFSHVSVTWGGPGSIQQDGDNEIDAVGGLTEGGTGVGVPEPASALLIGLGLLALGAARRKR
jgi:hypothetical protein